MFKKKNPRGGGGWIFTVQKIDKVGWLWEGGSQNGQLSVSWYVNDPFAHTISIPIKNERLNHWLKKKLYINSFNSLFHCLISKKCNGEKTFVILIQVKYPLKHWEYFYSGVPNKSSSFSSYIIYLSHTHPIYTRLFPTLSLIKPFLVSVTSSLPSFSSLFFLYFSLFHFSFNLFFSLTLDQISLFISFRFSFFLQLSPSLSFSYYLSLCIVIYL